jgi:site-specific recombinase XerD
MTHATPSFAVLLQGFFTQRLMRQREASPHTIGSYRDTFRLLLRFAQTRLQKTPARFELSDIDAPLVAAFLDELEKDRKIAARSRNLRLTAIRSFFRYAALEAPENSAQIQRILAIPSKRHTRSLVTFLGREEVEALLEAPDQRAWLGRRDHVLLLLTVQTGMRLSEMTGLQRCDVVLGTGAHIRVTGKGRKERSIPLTKRTVVVLKSWMQEPVVGTTGLLCPSARGGRLSADGMQSLLKKHISSASKKCPSLVDKRITPHSLRHTMAMELLQAGVEPVMIALWLGHESVATTQIYLHANLALKESILAKTALPEGRPGRYRPDDQLLDFLQSL